MSQPQLEEMGTGWNLKVAPVLWMVLDLLQKIFVRELAGNDPAAVGVET